MEQSRPPSLFEEAQRLTSQQVLGAGYPGVERRGKIRYSLQLDVRFLVPGQRSRTYVVGRTIDFSSNGLLIASAYPVKKASPLQLMIEWPCALEGRIPLQLVANAVVMRCTESSFAVAIRSYQFRTMKQPFALGQVRSDAVSTLVAAGNL